MELADLQRSDIDLAIRYGSGKWPDVQAIHLMDNEVFPVCSPDYLRDRRPLKKPRDLLEESLLHLIEYDRNWVTWEAWLQNFGVPWKPAKRGLEFDNYLVLVQGALDGPDRRRAPPDASTSSFRDMRMRTGPGNRAAQLRGRTIAPSASGRERNDR